VVTGGVSESDRARERSGCTAGEIFTNESFAQTLRELGSGGASAFYTVRDGGRDGGRGGGL
jgi:hypothetical protein